MEKSLSHQVKIELARLLDRIEEADLTEKERHVLLNLWAEVRDSMKELYARARTSLQKAGF